MRSTIIPLVPSALVLAVSVGVAHAQSGWTWQAPDPYPMQTSGEMGFLDETTGYMVGLGETTLVTRDGGRSWAPADVPRHEHNCVFALDAQRAWMFGNFGMRTTDGGATWEDLGIHTAWTARFLDPQFGWTSDNYAAQVTHDGGTTWTSAITGGGTRIVYPDFIDDQIGLGEQANFGSGVWRTADGGASWTKVLTAGITGVRFVAPGVAIAVGDGTIYRSSDAGLSWTSIAPGFPGYPQIIVLDEAHVIVNAQTAYTRSDDGGLTWTALPAPPANLKEVWVRNGPDAFAVTNNGEILRSADAFLTWESVHPATHIGLSDIQFLPGGKAVASGSDLILRSDDGGSSWTAVNSGTPNTVADIEMLDADRGLAIADNGFILRTTDGGGQWTPSRPSYEQGYGWNECTDLFVLNGDTAFVSGSGGPGPMIRTTDGGATWEPMAYPLTTQIESIWFVDEQHGWIGRGYTSGWIYRTADGGDTWEEVWPQSFGGIWDIQFHDLELGWANRGGNYVLRTTNGGDTWTQHILPGAGNYVKFEFVSEHVGYAVGANAVAKTTNGGLSWSALPGAFPLLLDLRVVSEDEVWVVGAANARMHTTDGGATWESRPVEGVDLPEFQSWHAIDVMDDGRQLVAGSFGVILAEDACASPDPGDVDCDGAVTLADLLAVLAAWGECPPGAACPADLTGDDVVGLPDLLVVLANWS